jgi:hypothetical protein
LDLELEPAVISIIYDVKVIPDPRWDTKSLWQGSIGNKLYVLINRTYTSFKKGKLRSLMCHGLLIKTEDEDKNCQCVGFFSADLSDGQKLEVVTQRRIVRLT